jgi:hypothetical protein
MALDVRAAHFRTASISAARRLLVSPAMGSLIRASIGSFTATIAVLAVACGGTSVSHGVGDGMAGMSESGGTSGTTGGSSGKGGGTTGGTGSTGAFGGSGGTNSVGGSSGSSGSSGSAGASGSAGRAGAGGASGSAGDAGSAGSAGSSGTPCITGGMCSTEGAQCSEGACCSCSHTCSNGVWGQPLCPPCLAPICPQDPPTNGDACSSCAVPPEGCMWDRRPVDGPLYTAECVNDAWVVMTSFDPLPSCCMNDAACGPVGCGDTTSCPQPICVNGVCESPLPDACWRDDQCGSGKKCSGAAVCNCGTNCGTRDRSGICVPSNDNCCLSDADCPNGDTCFAGICKARPTQGCWQDEDCTANGICSGAVTCPCGRACLIADSPGTCVYPI